ncbi:uncharacterized protein F5Z01DRAFT_635496 [Emericellopsis atlantica]|uniref:Zn(2)-C6 fungal-type domain-containing protein n=1 Tax=Emericellopsis atlantica TaxID=2614577 RepID=A0A9P8CQ35_9HYPO|nr:uncharacterized protein F5Z01DRAFT_635496 [Emericellopsis atlantica]KAG9255208.1 hypothetical protein F5Z01DRAFT_635496 [Emericellopsis atlantica]
MVYCGKASQGCQSCRKRRIKCDKVKPECSQCVRIGKKCSGYRDQLSLMFRDESAKVMQKAHAQWGVGEEGVEAGTATAYDDDAASSSKSPTPSFGGDIVQLSPVQTLPSPPASQAGSMPSGVRDLAKVQAPILPTSEEQGFQFYVNRYLVGHPDEPRNLDELRSDTWLWDPALKDVSAALGLASLSNLRGDHEMMVSARKQYGKALRMAGSMLMSKDPSSVDVTARLVVLLAMYELVKGTELTTGTVYAHVAGGAALIRQWYPMRKTPCGGVRPLLQLCFSTFLTAYEIGIALPAEFNDWVAFCQQGMPADDQRAPELGLMIARFIKLASYTRFNVLQDGIASTAATMQEAIDIEKGFEKWEDELDGHWLFTAEKTLHLPPAAVFQGEYHDYYDMWVARIWNYYRWARILANQQILDLADKYPASCGPLLARHYPNGRNDCIDTAGDMARDILASTPSHWRHPLLGDKTPLPVQQQGGAGAGAAGIPVLLFQLRAAACAPGVPIEYWSWAYGVMECVWGDMGMQHAKSMMDALLAHRESLRRDELRDQEAQPKERFFLGLIHEG